MRQLLAHWLHDVDDLLRGEKTRPQSLADRGLEVPTDRLLIVIVALAMIYGLCMGSFSLQSGRYMQIVASVVKTPALFLLTLLVTLPSLYVFNALVGSRLRLVSLLKLLIASLVVNTAVLASLGPIVAFFSLTTTSHPFIVLLNVAVFSVSGVLGLMFLLQTLHRLTNLELWRSQNEPVPLEPITVGDQEQNKPPAEDLSALDMPRATSSRGTRGSCSVVGSSCSLWSARRWAGCCGPSSARRGWISPGSANENPASLPP